MIACTSHTSPDREQAEDPPPPVVTSAPTGWAARVDAGGDVVVGLAALTDGGTAVLTYEQLDTTHDETTMLSRYDAVGHLSFSKPLGPSYRDCRRCLAAVEDGGIALLDPKHSRIEIHAADGRTELLDVPPAEPFTRGVVLRSHPRGGFVIGSSLWLPFEPGWDAAGHARPWMMHMFFGRVGAVPADERGRASASWMSLGRERAYWAGGDMLIDLAIAADGTFAAVISCSSAIGPQRSDAVSCGGGAVIGQWDASGELEWLRPIGSTAPDSHEGLLPIAIAPHPADGFALFGSTSVFAEHTPSGSAWVHYGRDGSTISTTRLPIGRGALHDAGIAGRTAWLAVTEPAQGPAPSERRVGAIVRVDLDTGEHASMPLRPLRPTSQLTSGDVMTPRFVATHGDQVRVAGFYGWPSRVPLVDRPSVDLELRDPHGHDDEVFVWAMTPGATSDR